MRIASLVPSATELLFALGLGESVVAVTHECDHPTPARDLPHLTRTVIAPGLGPAAIDAAVRERTGRGEALYELDEPRLRELEPDLIVTQAVCEVCAVSFEDVRAVAQRLPSSPRVLSLDPATLDEVLADTLTLADATGERSAGAALLESLRARLRAVGEAVAGAPAPAVAALEWLDPVFIGGHWVPEMIARAGGRDALGEAGARSRTADWGEVAAARPDVVVVMPCGYDTTAAEREAREMRDRLESLGAARIWAVDAAAYFSRPGPRLVDGVELLAHLLHPDRVPLPAGDGPPPFARVLETA